MEYILLLLFTLLLIYTIKKDYSLKRYYLWVERIWVPNDPDDPYSMLVKMYKLKLVYDVSEPSLVGYIDYIEYDPIEGHRVPNGFFGEHMVLREINTLSSLLSVIRYVKSYHVDGVVMVKSKEDANMLIQKLTANNKIYIL